MDERTAHCSLSLPSPRCLLGLYSSFTHCQDAPHRFPPSLQPPYNPKMTFCYQRQCEDSCYSPCGYGTVFSSRSYDCGSPCGYQGYYGRLVGYRDCYPAYSSRYCSPYSSRYVQRFSYGSCSPCYQC